MKHDYVGKANALDATVADEIPASMLYGTAALSALVGGVLLRKSRSAFGHAAGGFLLGAGAALAALLELPRLASAGAGHEEEPSTASRILARIPLRVKLATVVGAVKGGGGAALHAASDKIARSVRESRPRPSARPVARRAKGSRRGRSFDGL